jgi:Lon protease-like protein
MMPLRIFEPRYVDMVRECMGNGQPFGIVLARPKPAAPSEATEDALAAEDLALDVLLEPSQFADHYEVGTLATVVDFDMREPGVLLIAVQGGQRFRVQSAAPRPNGLLQAEVELIPLDEPRRVKKAHAVCAELLENLLREIDRQYKLATKAGHAPFCQVAAKPYRFDDASWLSYRHAELMPIPKPAKNALLGINSPHERLDLILAFLKEQEVA